MGLEVLKRTSIANIVSAALLIIAAVGAIYTGNWKFLETIALIAAGYLFGRASREEKP